MGENYCGKCNKKLVTCPTCKGKGVVWKTYGLSGSNKQCENCNGTGKLCPQHGNNY